MSTHGASEEGAHRSTGRASEQPAGQTEEQRLLGWSAIAAAEDSVVAAWQRELMKMHETAAAQVHAARSELATTLAGTATAQDVAVAEAARERWQQAYTDFALVSGAVSTELRQMMMEAMRRLVVTVALHDNMRGRCQCQVGPGWHTADSRCFRSAG
ncbi:hypothetical protein [Spirillospora sp. NPDC047279]|uniref:hypothetical protein n=1 Tax=Spirillospora sp. NPDC047279 TaxID=3155478 RepID=UPI0033D8B1C4